MTLLQDELIFMLKDIHEGDFYQRFGVAKQHQVIKDIAISGNGEPTSLENFPEAVALIGEIATEKIAYKTDYVLITNGSLVHKDKVRRGITLLNQYHGQVWFKLDCATNAGLKTINHAAIPLQKQIENLLITADICPTWLQTCVLKVDDRELSGKDKESYLLLLKKITSAIELQGVMLYTIARPSLQPEAARIEKGTREELNKFAKQIRKIGVTVKLAG
jgi:wyosine [tRNA(Phe)-imidazoG37] synthetase (radical SAM superfamily)